MSDFLVPAIAADTIEERIHFQVRHPPALLPIKLGFDTYSLRAFRWKALQLLDYAAAQTWRT